MIQGGLQVNTCIMSLVSRPLQGLVFLAFGFNLVDCGGLLGGRLDSGDAKLPSKKVCTDST